MRWNLPPGDLPTSWFNVTPHLTALLASPLHPGTNDPICPEDLSPLFLMSIITQEASTEPTVDIPGAVLDVLEWWRPTPLVRATRLEKALGTPARMYCKHESVPPAGSLKPNTAVPQAYDHKTGGMTRLPTETGAGQWGRALAFASSLYGLECMVFMVRASFQQKPHRRVLMETWGARVAPSRVDDPTQPGSLGTAIIDALRDAAGRDDTHLSVGSWAAAPTSVASAFPSFRTKACNSRLSSRRLARRSLPAGSTTTSATPPGSPRCSPCARWGTIWSPRPSTRMGLRDHGDWSIISALFKEGRMEEVAYPKSKAFEAGLQFACTQGTIPAPESTHAICAAIDEAQAAKEQGEERVILIDYSGHGLLDLCAYDDFLHDRLADRASGPDGISTQTMTRRPNGTGRARWRR